ncbi:DUF4817 domain-containing protein [Aphis craccivora]|uniref:DUF4817 domain-containing protein n=1 Tax=Aphis craccivora TaxID=307492 RepID=A0A6G0VW91_APHCR|nr:DUF4817 domain-containing protein [Aphis craccivora]
MPWSGEQRGFVIEAFFKNAECVIATQRAFRTRFSLNPNESVPDRKTILNWLQNLRATGSAMSKKPVGRPKSVRTPENIAAVRTSIEQSPSRSARKHASALGISDRTVRRILHYYCNAILTVVPPNGIVWSSDEAHFHISGTVNKQNFCYWAAENPLKIHQRPLHSPKVTVWCALSSVGIVGPYFFEEGGVTVTVTSNRYCEMLENFLRPKIKEYENNDVFWFQQDGATAHTARCSRAVLQKMFPGRLISLRENITWPPRSSDLNPCDYFLWRYLKAEVFKHRPRTIEELKEAIRQEISAIPLDMLAKVMENFRERLHMCVARQGNHLDDITFKK